MKRATVESLLYMRQGGRNCGLCMCMSGYTARYRSVPVVGFGWFGLERDRSPATLIYNSILSRCFAEAERTLLG